MKMIMRILKFLIVAAQGITSGLLIYTLFHLNVLQTWQNLVATSVLVTLFLICLKVLIFPKKRFHKDGTPKNPKLIPQIIFTLLSLATSVGALAAYHYIDPISDFIADITKESKTHVKVYNLLTPKLTDADQKRTLEDYRDKEIGFLSLDPYMAKAESTLKEKISFTNKTFDDIDTITTALDNKSLPAIVLEAERFEALAEIAETKKTEGAKDSTNSSTKSTQDLATFADRVEVTYTFEITAEDTNYSSSVNITKDPFIAYISGTDSRQGINGIARSDVNILAVVNPIKNKILLLTIPRDTYVQLHGTTGIKDKLTHAGIYGIDMSKNTIEDFLNIKIDHTIKVSFATVVNVVDAIGGIEINSDTAMTLKVEGKDKKCTYVVGNQTLDGDCALRYARERKTYYIGDIHRGRNQQQVITAIIDKVSKNKSLLTDYPRILKAAEGTFETSFTYNDITSFVRYQLAEGKSWQTESIDITGNARYAGTYSMGEKLPLYVMDADESSIKNAQAKIAEYLAK
ncbi:LCP family protein [Candidatus Saccharibacteria bacterium]|nr:LCP family protein [Candidatus Saccharibacteria bacterium]